MNNKITNIDEGRARRAAPPLDARSRLSRDETRRLCSGVDRLTLFRADDIFALGFLNLSTSPVTYGDIYVWMVKDLKHDTSDTSLRRTIRGLCGSGLVRKLSTRQLREGPGANLATYAISEGGAKVLRIYFQLLDELDRAEAKAQADAQVGATVAK